MEGLGIPQCRFIKYTLGSIQEAYTQILSGSHDYKMGAILSADQAGGSLSFADPKDDLHMEHRPVFICPDHAVALLYPVIWLRHTQASSASRIWTGFPFSFT